MNGHKPQSVGQSPSQMQDFGFGDRLNHSTTRFLNPDGTYNIIRLGGGKSELHVYQWLVLMSWPKFLMAVLFLFIGANSFFATLFMLNGGNNITNIDANDGLELWWHCFFFSAQTLTTVGYGNMSPVGFTGNMLAAAASLFGLLSFALTTGLLFARFSKPSAKLLFSEHALISPYNNAAFPGVEKAFMFRLTNLRRNMLHDLSAQVVVSWIEHTSSGEKRSFRTLTLERDQVPMLPLNWVIVHPIDENSPLKNWSFDDYRKNQVEFMVLLKAYDDTFGQHVRTGSSYVWEQLRDNVKFKPMYYPDESGGIVLDLSKIDEFG